jgi:carbon-monoxide dehydrogenase large subunit
MLEASALDVVVGDGGLHVAGVPTTLVSWSELAVASRDSAYPFGAHVSVVEVDTETGQVAMVRHVAVDDCGRICRGVPLRGVEHTNVATV